MATVVEHMETREVVTAFWDAMQANDWRAAAALMAADCHVDWVCSGERLVGRDNFVAAQENYPTNTGRWTFDIHRVVVDGDTAVSEVTASDGEQHARVVAFSTVSGGQIVHQTEYWPTSYEAPSNRSDITVPGERLP